MKRARIVWRALAAAFLFTLSPSPALAVPDPPASAQRGPAKPPPTPPTPPVEDVPPDSPRASVLRFQDLCNAGEWAEAATYLDVPDARKADAQSLARHLHAVLDRQLWGKIETVSANPAGNLSDHLPAGVDEIGSVGGRTGPEPIRVVRRHLPEGTRWVFSRTTVEHVDDWYGHLLGRWQQEWIPRPLLRHGPKGLLIWQWLALPVLFALSVVAGWLLGQISRLAITRAFGDRKVNFDRPLFVRLGAPLTSIWAVAGVDLAVPYLQLLPSAQAFMGELSRAGYVLGAMWLATRCVDIAGARILAHPNAQANPAARSLVPLGTKSLKVVLTIVAVLLGLSELNVAVGSVLAGLGIGGVALALAAQKTVENLFGSLSIGVDQPFRVGDFVAVDTISGVVETIGLRSTRIRTLDRTIVTFPNGKLADMRIESFAQRDRIKLACTLALDRGSTSAQVRAVVDGARELLTNYPKAWPDPTVAFSKVSPESLDVEILAWLKTTSSDEFVSMREELLLQLMDIVNAAGTKLAPPPA